MAPYVNAVYYPSWQSYKGRFPSHIPVSQVTHIYYAFLRINNDGSIRLLDANSDTDRPVDGANGCLGALAHLRETTNRRDPSPTPLASSLPEPQPQPQPQLQQLPQPLPQKPLPQQPHHQQHQHRHQQRAPLRTLISIGGGGTEPTFNAIAASPSAVGRFAASVRAFVDTHSFDGVDIDWEHPKTQPQGEAYLSLLAALRSHLPAPQYLVTTALPVGTYCLGRIDVKRLDGLVDMVNLMGYDFHGTWSEHAGHQAQLFPPPPPTTTTSEPRPAQVAARSCTTGIDYLVRRGLAREKIVLGVPTYARCFAGARGVGDRFDTVATAESQALGLVENRDLAERVWRGANVDQDVCAAWAVDEDSDGDGGVQDTSPSTSTSTSTTTTTSISMGTTTTTRPQRLGFVSFDTPEIVRRKAKFAKQNRLGGLFYWHVFADGEGSRSLIRAGREELDTP